MGLADLFRAHTHTHILVPREKLSSLPKPKPFLGPPHSTGLLKRDKKGSLYLGDQEELSYLLLLGGLGEMPTSMDRKTHFQGLGEGFHVWVLGTVLNI